MKPNEIYQSVTDTIIDLLENHTQSWDRPWIALGQDNDYAKNAKSKKYYRGINQFLLGLQLTAKGYFKNQWLTFNQAKDMGGHIKKGEKSTPVIFYKTAYIDKDKKFHSKTKFERLNKAQQKELGLRKIPVLKLFRVFNVSQTEELNASFYEIEKQDLLNHFEKDDRAEKLIHSTDANIEIKESNEAFYNLLTDTITLPLREQFKSQESFYATALHELGHWTGHPQLLNRDLTGKFGNAAYGKEELVAELTSAFCCAAIGFSKTITNNAAYLNNWLSAMKEDNKAIVRAANQAQKAADYILDFSSENTPTPMTDQPTLK
ncbi:MAG: zincin-like metallopeptidase domain-containing protein [Saprospiraceae bacterium]|jgi:antirestriction protein ArdC|nr:zincin-like metallopeptidase domain-containing protein [Saprospiraceae bacterium]